MPEFPTHPGPARHRARTPVLTTRCIRTGNARCEIRPRRLDGPGEARAESLAPAEHAAAVVRASVVVAGASSLKSGVDRPGDPETAGLAASPVPAVDHHVAQFAE